MKAEKVWLDYGGNVAQASYLASAPCFECSGDFAVLPLRKIFSGRRVWFSFLVHLIIWSMKSNHEPYNYMY